MQVKRGKSPAGSPELSRVARTAIRNLILPLTQLTVNGNISAMSTAMSDQLAKENISRNVRAILARRKWTTSELVARTGLPTNTVYRIVRGENLPNSAHLKSIADALGVRMDRLISEA